MKKDVMNDLRKKLKEKYPDYAEQLMSIYNKTYPNPLSITMDNYHEDELLLEKLDETEKPFVPNPITEWGVKYEEIATKFYESMNQIKIKEFGMIPHPDFPIFGASPDGICDDTGPIEYTGRKIASMDKKRPKKINLQVLKLNL